MVVAYVVQHTSEVDLSSLVERRKAKSSRASTVLNGLATSKTINWSALLEIWWNKSVVATSKLHIGRPCWKSGGKNSVVGDLKNSTLVGLFEGNVNIVGGCGRQGLTWWKK